LQNISSVFSPKIQLKGVTANEFLTSKQALYTYLVIVFVSNAKANIPGEK
jgi:hypothetical protein